MGRAHLALVLAGLSGCGGFPEADPVGAHASPIIGGATTAAFPELAALLYDGDFHCSAVLVGVRDVATAAHCVYGLENDLAPLSVAFGPDLSQSPPVRGLTAATVHPEYATNQSRDIAMLTLSEDAPVAPVPWNEVPLGEFGPPLDLTLVGFGDPAYDDDQGPRVRRSVSVPLSELTSTTARWNEVGMGTCHGDSGGGAYADLGGGLVLVGIHSEGDPLCSGWGSAVRTDVFAPFLSAPQTGDDDDATSGFGDDDDSADPAPSRCDTRGAGSPLGGGAMLLVCGLALRRRRYLFASASSASAARRARSSF